MATSDLQNELLKPSFRVDQNTEKKLCSAVLLQLQDISGDISAMAVKWYQPAFWTFSLWLEYESALN